MNFFLIYFKLKINFVFKIKFQYKDDTRRYETNWTVIRRTVEVIERSINWIVNIIILCSREGTLKRLPLIKFVYIKWIIVYDDDCIHKYRLKTIRSMHKFFRITLILYYVLPHAAYSPDLALSDYHLFRSKELFLREKTFAGDLCYGCPSTFHTSLIFL